MKNKKLQVFVSSTFTDLKRERQAAVEAILSSGHIPAGMELFSAGDESQMTVIKRWIDESDIYMLILGGRYGSTEKISGKSYTHLEYEYANAQKKPLFSIVITKEALDLKVKSEGASVIEQDFGKELSNFRTEVLNNMVKFWDDTKDIKIAIHETLSDFSYRKDLKGWVKADNEVNAAFLAEEIARLTKENSDLRSKLTENNSNSPLYSSLTYSELRGLLERDKIIVDQGEINLFTFLMQNATALSNNNSNTPNELVESFKKLQTYKLVVEIGGTSNWNFIFSEEGHNFYLKALSNESL